MMADSLAQTAIPFVFSICHCPSEPQSRGKVPHLRVRMESRGLQPSLLLRSSAALLRFALLFKTPNELGVVEQTPVTSVLGRLRL